MSSEIKALETLVHIRVGGPWVWKSRLISTPQNRESKLFPTVQQPATWSNHSNHHPWEQLCLLIVREPLSRTTEHVTTRPAQGTTVDREIAGDCVSLSLVLVNDLGLDNEIGLSHERRMSLAEHVSVEVT